MQEILVIFMLHANILYMNTSQKFAKIPCLKIFLFYSIPILVAIGLTVA